MSILRSSAGSPPTLLAKGPQDFLAEEDTWQVIVLVKHLLLVSALFVIGLVVLIVQKA
jgi:hypothetical protein